VIEYDLSATSCVSCQSSCKFCKYIVGAEINFKSLVLYTQLPELWDIFRRVISLSNFNPDSGYSLDNLEVVLNYSNIHLAQLTHNIFWSILIYFLDRTNQIYFARKRRNS
jgi:hypothetical protein